MGKYKKFLKATKRSNKNRQNKSSKLAKFSILGTNAAGLKAKKKISNYSTFQVL